jgi:hypothetical protein
LENHNNYSTIVSEGIELMLDEIQTPFRDVLREKYWCGFEQDDAGFVHFGWDYYMYIGVSTSSSRSIQFARTHGLFVEEFISPYDPSKDG